MRGMALFSFKKKEQDEGAAQQLFDDGMRFVELKQHDAAIKELQQALQADPSPELAYDALHQIGLCYFSLEKYKDALSFFDRAMKSEFSGEKKSGSYYYKGISILKKNKPEQKTFSAAFDCFYHAAELNKADLDARYMQGCMTFALGEAKEATQLFEGVLRDQPGFENFFENSLFAELQGQRQAPPPGDGEQPAKPKEYKAKVGLRVTNYPELIIANFLFDNDIKFQYKPLATWAAENFEPLFYLPKFDVYLEHFSEEGDSMQQRLQRYAEKNKTCISTSAKDEEDLPGVLKVKLKDYLVSLAQKQKLMKR